MCVCVYMRMYALVFLSYDLPRVVGDSTYPGKVSDANSKLLQGFLFFFFQIKSTKGLESQLSSRSGNL